MNALIQHEIQTCKNENSSTNKLKIFQIIQRQYAILGISSTNQSAQKLPFNRRVLIGLLFFGCIFTLQFVYIFQVASDFMEYTECICATSGNILIFVCFMAIVLGNTTLFECIDNLEQLIDTSKAIATLISVITFSDE